MPPGICTRLWERAQSRHVQQKPAKREQPFETMIQLPEQPGVVSRISKSAASRFGDSAYLETDSLKYGISTGQRGIRSPQRLPVAGCVALCRINSA